MPKTTDTTSKILDFSNQKVIHTVSGVSVYSTRKGESNILIPGLLTLILKNDRVYLTWKSDSEEAQYSGYKTVNVSDNWNLIEPLEKKTLPNKTSSTGIIDSFAGFKKQEHLFKDSIWINLGQQLKSIKIFSSQFQGIQIDYPYIEMNLKPDDSVYIQNEPNMYSFHFIDGMVVLNSFVRILNRFCWLQKTNNIFETDKCETFIVLDHHSAIMGHIDSFKKQRMKDKPVTSILGNLAKFSNILKREITNIAKPIAFTGITIEDEIEPIIKLDAWEEEKVKKGEEILKYSLECPTFPENITFSTSTDFEKTKSKEYIDVLYKKSPLSKTDIVVCKNHPDNTHLVDSCGLIKLISKKGLSPDLRKEIWPFILNMYPYDSTLEQQNEIYIQKTETYNIMKNQWSTMLYEQECNFSDYAIKKSSIEKDVNRADRKEPFYSGENNPNCKILNNILMTHMMYNFDLGYVQGMVDILTPLLYLFQDEVTTFWCFSGMIKRISHNFDLDQLHTMTQINTIKKVVEYLWPDFFTYLKKNNSDDISFCFPWVLILLKRQFTYDDIFILWEKILTQTECIDYIVFLSATIIGSESSSIVINEFSADQILSHFNRISCKINVRYLIYLTDQIISNLKSVPHLPPQISELLLP